MVNCPFCDNEATHQSMDTEKQERLQAGNKDLADTELAEVHCSSCGHTWYVKEDDLTDLEP